MPTSRFLRLLCLSLLLLGQGAVLRLQAGEPLRYTPADSVSLEDMFWTRAATEVWQFDSTLQARPVQVGRHDVRQVDKLRARLQALGPTTLWGGVGAGLERDAKQLRRDLQVLDLSARLFALTREAGYAELMERTLYNSVRAATAPSLPRSARRHAAPWLLAARGLMYAAAGADVYVNLYMRSRALVHTDSIDFLVLQNTSAPWQNNVFFSFRFIGLGRHMRLHLRLPGWLRGETGVTGCSYLPRREYYELTINNRPTRLRAKNGYITIDREWENDDVMVLKMDTPVRRIVREGDSAHVALQFGPLLYLLEHPQPAGFAVRPADAIGFRFDGDSTHAELLNGHMVDVEGREKPFRAIPYYIQQRADVRSALLWLPAQLEKQSTKGLFSSLFGEKRRKMLANSNEVPTFATK